jgi:hypothetical protein
VVLDLFFLFVCLFVCFVLYSISVVSCLACFKLMPFSQQDVEEWCDLLCSYGCNIDCLLVFNKIFVNLAPKLKSTQHNLHNTTVGIHTSPLHWRTLLAQPTFLHVMGLFKGCRFPLSARFTLKMKMTFCFTHAIIENIMFVTLVLLQYNMVI